MCFCLCISNDTSNSLSSGSPCGSCILASMCILVQMNEIKQEPCYEKSHNSMSLALQGNIYILLFWGLKRFSGNMFASPY